MKNKFDTIVVENIFGTPMEEKGTIIGYYENGYNLQSGGWSLYKIEKDAAPAKFMIFRPYKGKKKRCINMNLVKKIIPRDKKKGE